MTENAVLQLLLYVAILVASAKPLGAYMARIYQGEPAGLNRLGAPIESLVYRIGRVDASTEMHWTQYALAMLAFNLLGVLAVYGIQRLQAHLPLNPQGFSNVSPDSSFNTAASFATNTNWQGYWGRGHHELSHPDARARGAELPLGGHRHGRPGGADPRVCPPYRGLRRQLLGGPHAHHPLYPAAALDDFRLDPGRPGNGPDLQLLPDGAARRAHQLPADEAGSEREPHQGRGRQSRYGDDHREGATPALGPAASQVAIKQLGTNGGGFFNANSAHPFENPTPLCNFLEMLAILLIPAALCYTFGKMVGDTRQGWAILAAMSIVFVVMAA